jgi:hypothetical protein
MRIWFSGPRIMGIRPGISFDAKELKQVPWLNQPTAMTPLRLILAFVVIFVVVFGYLMHAYAAEQSMTDGRTTACLKEADFERYATLLQDDISAGIAYAMDHQCIMLPAKTFVRIDHGSTQNESNHVCIRPTSSYNCLWTFAGNLKK